MGLLDFFKKKPTEEQKVKLDEGLEKTRSSFISKIVALGFVPLKTLLATIF